MKKIIALVVAIIMMAAIAVPAFADVPVSTVDNGMGADTTLVEYGVTQSYWVTIPEKITFSADRTATAEITASNVIIAGNQTLQIKVSSNNYSKGAVENDASDDTWVLKEKEGKSDDLNYMIKVGEANVVSGETVILSVTADDELSNPGDVTSGTTKSGTLNFSTPGTSQVGTYQDTLTFSASVV